MEEFPDFEPGFIPEDSIRENGLEDLDNSKLPKDVKTAIDEVLKDKSYLNSLNEDQRKYFLQVMREFLDNGESESWDFLVQVDYNRKPVSPKVFFSDPYYFGKFCETLFPVWREDLHTVFSKDSKIREWFMNGAIGVGKTFCSSLALGYKIYEVSCLKNPQSFYGLSVGTDITYAIYSISMDIAEQTSWGKLKGFIKESPYFQEKFPLQRKGGLSLPNNVEVIFGSNTKHALSRNIYSFVMDEANFMSEGIGFDLYSQAKKRITSRFFKSPGIIILMSSRRAKTDFLEELTEKLRGSESVYISEYSLWEARWESNEYSGEFFDLQIGNDIISHKILDEGEEPHPECDVIQVPVEHRDEFELNIDESIRDLAGIATMAVNPFIRDKEKLLNSFNKNRKHPFVDPKLEPIISLETEDEIKDYLDIDYLCKIHSGRYVPKVNSGTERYIRIDAGLKRDSLGFCMCHISKPNMVDSKDDVGHISRSLNPEIFVDMVLRVRPPKDSEIDLSKIVQFVFYLKSLGYNIASVTMDQFASPYMLQLFKKGGFESKCTSVDSTDEAYLCLRNLIMTNKIDYYYYPILYKELSHLEHKLKEGRNKTRRKVDHPEKFLDGTLGAKDVSDALAGSVFDCLNSKGPIKSDRKSSMIDPSALVDSSMANMPISVKDLL